MTTEIPQKDRSDLSVGIGFPCGPFIPAETAFSLGRTLYTLAKFNVPVEVHPIIGSSAVEIARDAALTKFLEKPQNFLFWIDSDIVWTPTDFLKVLKHASKRGIACASYPLKRDPPLVIVNMTDGADLSPEGLVEIDSAALGFCCIRRDVIEKFADTRERYHHNLNDSWQIEAFGFRPGKDKEGRRTKQGEDVAFFNDLRDLGYKVYLDATIQLGHVGVKTYRMPLEEIETPKS